MSQSSTYKPRTEAELNDALIRFCDAAWGSSNQPIFSIPANEAKDADLILADGIKELVELRAKVKDLEQQTVALKQQPEESDGIKLVVTPEELYAVRFPDVSNPLYRPFNKAEPEIRLMATTLALSLTAKVLRDFWLMDYTVQDIVSKKIQYFQTSNREDYSKRDNYYFLIALTLRDISLPLVFKGVYEELWERQVYWPNSLIS